MVVDEREVERVLARLERIKVVVIDASSIIYAEKSGFLNLLCGAIRLRTIPQVFAETGRCYPGIELVESVEVQSGRRETDYLLFHTAQNLGKPLVSEDRAILLRCKNADIEYYNAYMMLIMLTARRIVDDPSPYRSTLLDVAHYGRPVIEYADSFFSYLSKML